MKEDIKTSIELYIDQGKNWYINKYLNKNNSNLLLLYSDINNGLLLLKLIFISIISVLFIFILFFYNI